MGKNNTTTKKFSNIEEVMDYFGEDLVRDTINKVENAIEVFENELINGLTKDVTHSKEYEKALLRCALRMDGSAYLEGQTLENGEGKWNYCLNKDKFNENWDKLRLIVEGNHGKE